MLQSDTTFKILYLSCFKNTTANSILPNISTLCTFSHGSRPDAELTALPLYPGCVCACSSALLVRRGVSLRPRLTAEQTAVMQRLIPTLRSVEAGSGQRVQY